MAQEMDKQRGIVIARNTAAVTVPAAGSTALIEIDVSDIDELGFSVAVATQALDAFELQARMGKEGSYVSVRSATWDTPGGVLVASSGDLAAQAAGTTGWAVVDVRPFYSIKLLASAAVDSAAVTTNAIGKGAVPE